MRTPLLIACWIGILILGGFLRFDDLSRRPFHADEATGARITAHRLESNHYVFDPLHYHGPTLSGLGTISARLHGMPTWSSLEKEALRTVPAVAGCLLLLTPLLGRRRFGDLPMLLAALALASSPLLVYYSRMYIHEMLLALFGALALFQLASARRWWLAGLWVGLMFATKETFAISIMAWSLSGAALYGFALIKKSAPRPLDLLKSHGRQALIAAALALAVSLAFYTNGFTYWQGAIDSVRTYFEYEVVEGHDKPWFHYLPYFASPLLLLALAAVTGAVFSKSMPRPSRFAIGFLALSGLVHLIIYSIIAYKTPWLMVLPWVHLCLLAGFVAALPLRSTGPRIALGLAVVLTISLDYVRSREATGRFASDDRNPYAYVPTSEDIETLGPWLSSLDAALPERSVEPIGVIGTDYWPLPWYLRHYDKVGYWTEPPESLERLPLVFATADLTDTLTGTHIPIPRGLRTDTPVMVWVRTDFWDASLTAPADE